MNCHSLPAAALAASVLGTPLPSTPVQARARREAEMPKWAQRVQERGISVE